MKKICATYIVLMLAVSYPYFSYSQSTQTGIGGAGHNPGFGGVPVRYVGWDASISSNAIPLSIEHRGTNNINFFTGATQRMTIRGTASGANAGFVGIGNSFNTPANRLHLFQPTGTFGLQITNTTTGNSAANGFSMNLIGVAPDNDLINSFIS